MSNSQNKQVLINVLCDKLKHNNIKCKNATDDADLLIVQTALSLVIVNGCYSSSRLFGIGKGLPLKKLNHKYQDQGFIKADTIKAGEEALTCLYGGIDIFVWRKLKSIVITGNTLVQVKSLPPTSDTGQFHSLRVYYQKKLTYILQISFLTLVDATINKTVTPNQSVEKWFLKNMNSSFFLFLTIFRQI
ncbi:unnamed protein product [Mytilus edulis]|uniref:Uncharacterized protein n=1 Tax=Mytilus edulis TaxID=6550 RepID=A0A8S3V4B0_MYTED|nr:unnamed protein product [Mytilus edulis]